MTRIMFSLIVSVIVISCSKQPTGPSDWNDSNIHPPATIWDIEGHQVGLNSVLLTWTSPAVSDGSQSVQEYDIRYSTVADYLQWDNAHRVNSLFTPSVAGESEALLVEGLDPSTEYYFYIKSRDSSGNWSYFYRTTATTLPAINTWMRVYENSLRVNSLTKAVDGGYMLLCPGDYQSTGDNYVIMKVDSLGNSIWQKGYSSEYDEVPDNMIEVSLDGYAIVGKKSQRQGCYYDIFLNRIDGSGNKIWETVIDTIGSCMPLTVDLTPDGNFIIGGGTFLSEQGGERALLIKISGNGEVIWKKSYPYQATYVRKIIVNETGEIIFAGSDHYWGNYLNLVKLSPDGEEIWQQTFNNVNGACTKVGGPLLTRTKNGSYLVLGGPCESNALIAEIDENGNILAEGRHYYRGIDILHSINPINDGSYIVTGTNRNYVPVSSLVLLKIDQSGSTIWSTNVDLAGGARSIQEIDDGGYLVAGWRSKRVSDLYWESDAMLMKVDAFGHIADSALIK